MKNGSGTPRRVTVKDIKTGKVIGRYNSVEKARQAFYPEKFAGFMTYIYRRKKQDFFTDYELGVSFFREGRGKYEIERAFRVIDRKTGKEKHYKNRTTMFQDIKGIGNAFNKQMKLFGNFKNDDYEIYPIS